MRTSSRTAGFWREADPFLRAVFAAPDDDAPRLVYADWLEEHGETPHAELIRAQCALDRMPVPEQFRSPLWPRLNPIWRSCEAEWSLEMMGIGFVDVIHFRRGFLETVLELHTATFIARSPYWWPRFPVRRVHLDDLDDLE